MNNKGFTLIELIVVISLIAITSVVAFVNFKTQEQDRLLVGATSDLVTWLRLAQQNAKSGVKCTGNKPSSGWGLYIADKTTAKLFCYITPLTNNLPAFGPGSVETSLEKTYPLNNPIEITSIGTGGCVASWPIQFEFSPLYGDIKFRTGALSTNYLICTSALEVKLINTTAGGANTKKVLINKAGSLDLQ